MPLTLQKPDDAFYGAIPQAYNQAYAQSLAKSSGNPTADAINQITLMQLAQRGGAGGGSSEYGRLIRDNNKMLYDNAGADRVADLDKAAVAQMSNMIGKGAGNAMRVMDGRIQYDDNSIGYADEQAARAIAAENLLKTAQAQEAQSKAGLIPDQLVPRAINTDPRAPGLVPPAMLPGMTLKDEGALAVAKDANNIDRITANAGMIRANNGEGRPAATNKEQSKIFYLLNPDGTRTAISEEVTKKGDAPARGLTITPTASVTSAPAVRKFIQVTVVLPNGNKVIQSKLNPAYKGP